MTKDTSDQTYTSFEDRFRGSPNEVTARLSAYLPVLDAAGLRDVEGPLLDLGCGRGEWLLLLAENGFAAKGIDLSDAVAARARERGLDVIQAEALQHLRSLPDASVAAVTAFHVVEHLPPGEIADLFAESYRVLRPGGLLIVETPNPENVHVSTSTFHLDVTHVAPLPPRLLEFLAGQAGFADPRIARVNADVLDTPLDTVPGDTPGALQINAAIFLLNQLSFIAPDYSIVAQKSGGRIDVAGNPALERLCGSPPEALADYRRLAAETLASRRIAEADARARESDAAAHAAATQVALIESSTSWQVTKPLRVLKQTARRVVEIADDVPPEDRSAKTYAKLAVGHPMRWLLTRPTVGPVLDRRLASVPRLDRKVRIAVYAANAAGMKRVARPDEAVEPQLRDLPEPARVLLGDLERALCDGDV